MMKIGLRKKFSKISQSLVYGGHLLSLGASSISLTVMLLWNQRISVLILAVAYLISQVVYSYNHVREMKNDSISNPERVAFLHKSKVIHCLLLSFYIVLLLVSLVFTNLFTALVALFIVLAGISYTEVFKRTLSRKLLGFKNYYTSFFWSLLVLLTFSYYSFRVEPVGLIMMIYVFLRLLLNTIFFDIKDEESDSQEGLITFPVLMGRKKVILLVSVLNLLSIVPLLVVLKILGKSTEYILLGLPVLYTFLYLYKSRSADLSKVRKLSYFLVDGEYLLWPLLVYLARVIS